MQKFKFFTLAILAMLSANFVWGESIFNITSYNSIPTGWTQSSVTTGSYFKLSAGGYMMSPEISAYNELSLSFKNAKYGEGTNPQLTVQILSSKDVVLASYTTGTPTSSTYLTFTQSLGDISESFKIKIINPTGNAAARLQSISLTGTPATPAVVRTVAWKVNNETYTAGNPTTQVNDGEAVTTLPTAPTIDCGGKTFVGWTATANYEHATAAPGDLFSTAANAPTVSGSSVTYYAVFADAGGSGKIPGTPVAYDGSGSMTLEGITGVTISGLGADYDPNTQGEYILKFDNTGDYIQFALDYPPTSLSFNYKMVGGKNTSTMYIKECSTASGTYSTVQSFSISGAQNSTGTKTTTSSFSQKYVRMEFEKGSNVGVGKITIQGYINGASYSNYTTTCATCTNLINITKGTPSNGSFTLTGAGNDICADEPVTVNLSNITADPHYHATAVTSSNGGTPSAITSDGSASVSGITASTTINVTFAEDTKVVVTLLNNNNPVNAGGFDAQGKKEYYTGEALGTLPTLTSDDACDATSVTFMGWTSDAGFQKRAAPPSSFVSASTTVNGDMTLRAVWAKEQ